jgi:LacI family transcriptional regulator
MNGDAPVKKETRKTVEAAIRKLGYVPSTAARAMRSNRSGLVGLITGAISTVPATDEPEGLPELHIVQGIQHQMADSGKTLLISDTGGRSDRVGPLVRTFMEHRVEGLIYVAAYHRHVELPPIPASVRLVLINCYDDEGSAAVLPDDAEGQRRLVAALVARGHRRIAYLTLSADHDATRLRLIGYRDALAAAGIGFDAALVASGDDGSGMMSREMMWRVVRAMMALDAPPTVICCGNDRMAMRLYGLLRAEGVAVPDQMSVAGSDD